MTCRKKRKCNILPTLRVPGNTPYIGGPLARTGIPFISDLVFDFDTRTDLDLVDNIAGEFAPIQDFVVGDFVNAAALGTFTPVTLSRNNATISLKFRGTFTPVTGNQDLMGVFGIANRGHIRAANLQLQIESDTNGVNWGISAVPLVTATDYHVIIIANGGAVNTWWSMNGGGVCFIRHPKSCR